MKLPKQTAPIQRAIPTASIYNANGVESSGILDTIWHGVKTYGPGLIKTAAGLLA